MDSEIESILKKELGISHNIDLEKIFNVPLSNPTAIELSNILKPYLTENRLKEELVRREVIQIKVCCFSRVI